MAGRSRAGLHCALIVDAIACGKEMGARQAAHAPKHRRFACYAAAATNTFSRRLYGTLGIRWVPAGWARLESDPDAAVTWPGTRQLPFQAPALSTLLRAVLLAVGRAGAHRSAVAAGRMQPPPLSRTGARLWQTGSTRLCPQGTGPLPRSTPATEDREGEGGRCVSGTHPPSPAAPLAAAGVTLPAPVNMTPTAATPAGGNPSSGTHRLDLPSTPARPARRRWLSLIPSSTHITPGAHLLPGALLQDVPGGRRAQHPRQHAGGVAQPQQHARIARPDVGVVAVQAALQHGKGREGGRAVVGRSKAVTGTPMGRPGGREALLASRLQAKQQRLQRQLPRSCLTPPSPPLRASPPPPTCEKASSPCAAIMHATAPVTVVMLPSWVRKKAGPRKPICRGEGKRREQDVSGPHTGPTHVHWQGGIWGHAGACCPSCPTGHPQRERAPPASLRRCSRAPHRLHDLAHVGDAPPLLHHAVRDPAAHVGGQRHGHPGQHGEEARGLEVQAQHLGVQEGGQVAGEHGHWQGTSEQARARFSRTHPSTWGWSTFTTRAQWRV